MNSSENNKKNNHHRRSPHPAEKHGAITYALRKRILANEFKPGDRLPTRRELAEELNTTLVTVQKAFARLEDDGFIESRPRLGTVVVEHPPHLCHFALLLNERPTEFRYQCALRKDVARRNLDGPKTFSIQYDIDRHASSPGQRKLMADIDSGRLAGCILDMHPKMLGDNPLLHDRTVPKVALVGDSHRPDIPSVTNDASAWFAQALDWLEQRGRRRIAWLGISNIGRRHIETFKEEAIVRGMRTSSAWTLGVDYHYPRWVGNALAAMFQGDEQHRPDALLVTDDNIAEAAVAGLAECGLRIPEDIDVVALNNEPLPLDLPAAVQRIGFSITERVDACLSILDQMRAGKQVERITRIQPATKQQETLAK